MKVAKVAAVLTFVLSALLAGVALADVNVRTPWSDVYVGPGGVEVGGPWGSVNVPANRRRRGCDRWRDEVEDYYDRYDCDVEFHDNGCAIEEVECDD